MLFAVALSLLPLSALAGGVEESNLQRRGAHRHVAARNQTRGRRDYNLIRTDHYQGQTFFDNFNFDTFPDPTHGQVTFQSREEATSKRLAYVQADNTTILSVDATTYLASGAARDSIRVTSKKAFNGGLFIADFFAMPHGCGTWPAYWLVGPNWPNGGEIDIAEGVHEMTNNQMTLHTSQGCNLNSNPTPLNTKSALKSNKAFTGQVLSTVCASSNTNNNGCGITSDSAATFGHGFNIIGGGVFATLWNGDGIAIWEFPRGHIPADVTAGNPDPTSWPTPQAFWAADACNMDHFSDLSIVLDITLCGDWAGNVPMGSKCPATCSEAVQDPANFKFANFKVNYIDVYQSA